MFAWKYMHSAMLLVHTLCVVLSGRTQFLGQLMRTLTFGCAGLSFFLNNPNVTNVLYFLSRKHYSFI